MRGQIGPPRSRPTALALVALAAVTACGPGEDGQRGAAPAARDSATPPSPVAGGTARVDPSAGAGGPARQETTGAGTRTDTPSAGGSGEATDDTVRAPGRYFVRLEDGADPEAVAERHGVDPLQIVRDPVPAFYAALDSGQISGLRRDTLVASLAREIHQGDTLRRPPIRGTVPPSETAGG